MVGIINLTHASHQNYKRLSSRLNPPISIKKANRSSIPLHFTKELVLKPRVQSWASSIYVRIMVPPCPSPRVPRSPLLPSTLRYDTLSPTLLKQAPQAVFSTKSTYQYP